MPRARQPGMNLVLLRRGTLNVTLRSSASKLWRLTVQNFFSVFKSGKRAELSGTSNHVSEGI